MKIIDIAPGALPEAAAKHQSQQSNTTFETLFTEAEQRQIVEPQNQAQNHDCNREQTPQNDTPAENPPPDEAADNAAYETPQYSGYEASAQEPLVILAPEEILVKVAETMYVPEEKVAEWLNKADLTPQELQEPQAVVKLIQTALDAEDPAELLTDEKFPELYKAVKEAVAETAIKPAAKESVQLSKEASETLAHDVETAIEDGKVVVKAAAKDETASTAKPQTSQQTDIPPREQSSEPNINSEAVKPEATVEAPANDAPPQSPTVSAEIVTARVEATVQQTAPPPPVNPADVIEQIMNQVKLQAIGGNFSEIRITLRPESLGDIVLRVMTQNGIVTAMFEAESHRVKAALEADFNSLRDALTEQGIRFSELSVYVRQDQNERMNQFERARRNSRNRAESIEEVEPGPISYHTGILDVTA